MSDYNIDIVKSLFECKKYDVISEFSVIKYPEQPDLIITEYHGNDILLYKDEGKIRIIIPYNMNYVQEGHIAKAIANGTIFDDAEEIDNNAKYIELRTIPYNAMINNGKNIPHKLKPMISMVIGKMDDEGSFEVDDCDITNGHNFVKDIVHYKDKGCSIKDTVDNYIGNDTECDLPIELGRNMRPLKNEIEDIRDTPIESCLDEKDCYDYDDEIEECGNCSDEEIEQESFISKKPKKLKPIPRDIIAYITTEMHAIRDSNDQAMLSGYTCSKLELVDFYLNIIDTQDARYIVPHDRRYLEQMQSSLNNLLTQILKIRPINRNDRVWRLNVNYPEGRRI